MEETRYSKDEPRRVDIRRCNGSPPFENNRPIKVASHPPMFQRATRGGQRDLRPGAQRVTSNIAHGTNAKAYIQGTGWHVQTEIIAQETYAKLSYTTAAPSAISVFANFRGGTLASNRASSLRPSARVPQRAVSSLVDCSMLSLGDEEPSPDGSYSSQPAEDEPHFTSQIRLIRVDEVAIESARGSKQKANSRDHDVCYAAADLIDAKSNTDRL